MHNNYFLFKVLVNELQPVLQGGVVSACFSQSKDELVVQIETSKGPFFIRALLLPVFSCISFPTEFHRARKNSIDLFNPLVGQRIEEIRTIENDRSFYFQFESGVQLIFKMHGNRSNIVLIQPGKPNLLFKNQLLSDTQLTIDILRKDIHYTYEAFAANLQNLQSYFVTFGKPVWIFLANQGFEQKDLPEKWKMFQDVLHQLNHPQFTLISDQQGLRLSLLKEPGITETFHRATDALTAFFSAWMSWHTFHHEYESVRQRLEQAMSQTESLIGKLNERLTELQREDNYKMYADLLMANLHLVPAGSTEVTLPDFIHGNPVRIKLKPELSAQKNAEVYYRKSRNRIIEIRKLHEQLHAATERHKRLTMSLQRLQQVKDLKQLRLLRDELALSGMKDKARERLPYEEVVYQGFVIRIGRSARDNDELTLRYAHKNDLWLHVRDAPGSHVIIRHQPGKPFSKEVIERAAQLAAWHSKRKTESLCPVIVTERKYVRKRKGDAPGSVIADKSRTILVTPQPE